MIKGKVGSKGELFPPKEIREQANLEIGHEVMYRVVHGVLMVERIYSPEEILKRPTKVKVTFEEIKKDRAKLSEELST